MDPSLPDVDRALAMDEAILELVGSAFSSAAPFRVRVQRALADAVHRLAPKCREARLIAIRLATETRPDSVPGKESPPVRESILSVVDFDGAPEEPAMPRYTAQLHRASAPVQAAVLQRLATQPGLPSRPVEDTLSGWLGGGDFQSSELLKGHLAPAGFFDGWRGAHQPAERVLVSLEVPYRLGAEPIPVAMRVRLAALTHLLAAAFLDERVRFEGLVDSATATYQLSESQAQVLGHAMAGLPEAEIAARLDRSHHTVNSHLRSIYRKAGVTSRGELLSAIDGSCPQLPIVSVRVLKQPHPGGTPALLPTAAGESLSPLDDGRLIDTLAYAMRLGGPPAERVRRVLEFVRMRYLSGTAALSLSFNRLDVKSQRIVPVSLTLSADSAPDAARLSVGHEAEFRQCLDRSFGAVLDSIRPVGVRPHGGLLCEEGELRGADWQRWRDVYFRPRGVLDLWSANHFGAGRVVTAIVSPQLEGAAPFSPDQERFLSSLLPVLAPISRSLVAGPGMELPDGAQGDRLSPAQREVLPYALTGLSEKEIATRVHRSPHTVHSHLKAIYRCYRVNSRAELLAMGLGSEAGLLGRQA